MYNQVIDKAYVSIVGENRIYTPYKGNFTRKLESKIYKAVAQYCLDRHITINQQFGWKTKGVVIKWPDKKDKVQVATYKEEGASGMLEVGRVWVCNSDYVGYLSK
jgi:hypothetical protein